MKTLVFSLLMLLAGTAKAITVFDYSTGSFIQISSTGAQVQLVSLSTGVIGSLPVSSVNAVFKSTFTTYSGYSVRITSGTIAANTTITISTTSLGATALATPVCVELEGVNTASVSVRVKSLSGLPNSFTVFNADVANAKNYICYVAGF